MSKLHHTFLEDMEPRCLLAGIELVKDIIPGVDPSLALSFERYHTVVARQKFFFVATDATHGRQVWMSDGTVSGTVPLIVPQAPTDANPDNLTAGDGVVYFSAFAGDAEQIFQTDGKTVQKMTIFSNREALHDLNFVNGQLLFFSTGSGGTVGGSVLWRLTVEGPRVLKSGASGQGAVVFNKKFIYGESVSGVSEPVGTYVTDGSTVTKLADSVADATQIGTDGKDLNNIAIYSASDSTAGRELWRSDGTIGGTRRLADINIGAFGSDPRNLVKLGNFIYFVAGNGSSGNGLQIYKTDGNGVTKVTNLSGTSSSQGFLYEMTNLNGTIFFTYGTTNRNLYKLVNDQPVLVGTGSGGAQGGTSPNDLTPIGNQLFFNGLDTTSKARLFVTDGATISLAPGAAVTNPVALTAVNSTLFFQAEDATHGSELFKIVVDGTTPPDNTPLSARIKVDATTVNEGSSVAFRAVLDGIKAGVTYRYRWDFDGNGTFIPGRNRVNHIYRNNRTNDAVRTAVLVVTGSDGQKVRATIAIKVLNAAPQFTNISYEPKWVSGLLYTMIVHVNDPGLDDKLFVNIVWPDGTKDTEGPISRNSGGAGLAIFDHTFTKTYSTAGNTRVEVVDEDNRATAKRLSVQILPLARINAEFGSIVIMGGSDGKDEIDIVKSPDQPGGDDINIDITTLIDGASSPVTTRMKIKASEILQFSMAGDQDMLTVDPKLDNPLWIVTDGLDMVRLRQGSLKPKSGALGVGTRGKDRALIKRNDSLSTKASDALEFVINGVTSTALKYTTVDTVMFLADNGDDIIQSTQKIGSFLAYGGKGNDTFIAALGACKLLGEAGIDKFKNLDLNDIAKQ